MARVLGWITVGVLLGCRPAPDTPGPTAEAPAPPAEQGAAVSLSTDRASYRAGEPLELRLSNRGETTYAFNPCFRQVARRADAGWLPVEEPERICTMEAWILEPGAARAVPTELPARLPPGRYRIALELTPEGRPEGDAPPVRAVSPEIAVEP